MTAPFKTRKPNAKPDKAQLPAVRAAAVPTVPESHGATVSPVKPTGGTSDESVNSRPSIAGSGGGDQISPAKTDDSPSDEKFIAEFRRISGPSPLVKALKLALLCATKSSFSAERSTLRKLKLSKSKFSKYARIGGDRRLDELRSRLPDNAGYSVLYAMSLLNDEQWKRGFKDGIISPRSSRSEIDAFRTGVPVAGKTAPNPPVPFFAAVTIPDKVGDKAKEEFRAALIALCEGVGFEAVFSEERASSARSKG